jgi:hypothetical protein
MDLHSSCFLIETVESRRAATSTNALPNIGPFVPLAVPDGLSYLSTPVRAVSRATCMPRLVERRPTRRRALAAVECVTSVGGRSLLMAPEAEAQARVNGAVAAPLVELVPGDRVEFPGGTVLHVSVYQRPYVGRLPAEMLTGGAPPICPVCRVPLGESTRVYVCPSCRTPMHLEGEEKEESERLECTRLSNECPVCQAPIRMEESYVYVPAE